MKKLPHDETVTIYKEMLRFFEEAKEMEKRDLSSDRRDLLLQIQDMWGKQKPSQQEIDVWNKSVKIATEAVMFPETFKGS